MNNNLRKVFNYTSNYLGQLSTKGVYIILLLFFAYKNHDTPSWAKRIIIGAIAYFISPIDSIPDLAPFIGMTDDIGVLSFGLVTIACYVNDDVREQALLKLNKLLSNEISHKSIEEVDAWL